MCILGILELLLVNFIYVTTFILILIKPSADYVLGYPCHSTRRKRMCWFYECKYSDSQDNSVACTNLCILILILVMSVGNFLVEPQRNN